MIDSVCVDEQQSLQSKCELGARALFGTHRGIHYYTSVNDNGAVRCSKRFKDGNRWFVGDVITVSLDLLRARVKYYLNGERQGKAISVQRGKTYFPVIAFHG